MKKGSMKTKEAETLAGMKRFNLFRKIGHIQGCLILEKQLREKREKILQEIRDKKLYKGVAGCSSMRGVLREIKKF